MLERYGKAVDIIEQDGFHINAKIYTVLDSENLVTMAKSTGMMMLELPSIIEQLQPDMLVTIADRYETIANAICASYMNIPVVHIQGGEITGSIDDKVRNAKTKLSDIHLVATEQAKTRLINMGESTDRVFVTGCPSIDIAKEVADERTVFHPYKEYKGVGQEVSLEQGYIVVLQHPVTTEYQASREQITETLKAIHAMNIPTLWFWPNVDAGSDGTSKGIRSFREQNDINNVYFLKNMKPHDFLRLLKGSLCIVGNSSVAIRECSYLGVPAVNIGSRQQNRERGKNVIDVPHDQAHIKDAIQMCIDRGHTEIDPLYGDGFSGQHIADILATKPIQIKHHV